MNQVPYEITIGWLYPDLMSTYGDRGNIMYLRKRCEWRNIKTRVVALDQQADAQQLKTVDFIFGGGSQDREQEIVMRDLGGTKSDALMQTIEKGVPALFVCGSPQLMGKWYEPAVGKRIQGIGIFDIESTSPSPHVPRCIGNTIGKVNWKSLFYETTEDIIIGFENHGGRTRLGKTAIPFATVIAGYGNNGKDKTEGVVYKNAIGCYYHGPFLPKNPHIADFFIQRIIEVKYKETIKLSHLDDSFETKARENLIHRFMPNSV